MRPPQRHLLTQIWLASSVLIFAACLAAADDAPTSSRRAATKEGAAAEGPSKLDFMVLASMADAPHLLAMAGYRPAPRPCAAHPAGNKIPQCRL